MSGHPADALLDPAPVRTHVGWTFASRAVSHLLGLGVAFVLVRAFDKDGLGALHFLPLLPQTILVFGELGLAVGALLELREHREKAEKLLSSSATLGFLLGCGYFVATAFALHLHPEWLQGYRRSHALLALAAMPPSLVTVILQPQLLPLGFLRTFHALPVAFNLLRLAGGVATWFLVGDRLGFFLAWLLGMNLLQAATVVVTVCRKLPLRPRLDTASLRGALRQGLPTVPTTAAAFVNTRSDGYLLQGLSTSAQLGLYGFLVAQAEHLFILPNAVSQGLLSRFTAPGGTDPSVTTARTCRHVVFLGLPASALSMGVLSILLRGGSIRWAEAWFPCLLLLGAVQFLSVTKVLTA
ncbi:MAG: oligosaccharide flippase family protein, partial [Planctomycetes bacterium]|nr:oligosaccharide flippase family protein [Planctomycetota bacterium]